MKRIFIIASDTGRKYKVRGDRLCEIALNDGTVLDTSLRRKELAERGVVIEFHSEKDGERFECTYTVKIMNKDALPIIIKGRD